MSKQEGANRDPLAWLDDPEECAKINERIAQAWRDENQLIGTDPYRTPEQKQREEENLWVEK